MPLSKAGISEKYNGGIKRNWLAYTYACKQKHWILNLILNLIYCFYHSLFYTPSVLKKKSNSKVCSDSSLELDFFFWMEGVAFAFELLRVCICSTKFYLQILFANKRFG